MSQNLTIESPNFDKIDKEAGVFTKNAIFLLWEALNDTRATNRRGITKSTEIIAPKVLTIAAAASVNNLDLQGASVLSFVGGSAQNLTGFRAPDTNQTRILFLQVSQAGTITVKNSATSETGNQIVTSTGADVALTTGKGMVLAYLNAKWRQVA